MQWAHFTNLFSPRGRKFFKMKRTEIVKVRFTIPEKKRVELKAKKAGLSMSEFMRRLPDNRNIKTRLTPIQQELLKQLIQEANRWQWVSNMFKKKDPNLSKSVESLVREFRIIIIKHFK